MSKMLRTGFLREIIEQVFSEIIGSSPVDDDGESDSLTWLYESNKPFTIEIVQREEIVATFWDDLPDGGMVRRQSRGFADVVAHVINRRFSDSKEVLINQLIKILNEEVAEVLS